MTRLASFGLFLSLCACGASSKSDVAFTESDQATFDEIELEMTQPISKARLEQLQKISIKKFYDSLLTQSTDDPFVVNGQVVRGVNSQLKGAEPYFNRLAEAYDSWGEFAASEFELSVAPGRQITRTVFSDLTRDFANRTGVFAKLKPTSANSKNKQKDAENAPLNLADARLDRGNLGALAALSLAIQFARGPGLGLATNSLDGAACNSLTDMSAINRLDIGNNSGAIQSICTGTFFKSDPSFDYMLTADHCTQANGNSFFTKNASGQNVQGIVIRNATGNGPEPKDVAKPVFASRDLSVIAFPVGTARGYMSVSTTAARTGDPVKLAGYGKRDHLKNGGSAGILNCGSNIVAQTVQQEGAIVLYGFNTPTVKNVPLGTGSVSSGGDSGGPLIRIAQDGKPEIIGVVSNGSVYDGNMPETGGFGNYTDVNSSWSKPFIIQRSNLKQQNIPYCTNGANNGNGYGFQPGIGGPDNKTCRVPQPKNGKNNQTPKGG